MDVMPIVIDKADPELVVHSNTSHLQYLGTGTRDFLRIARIIKDSFQIASASWPKNSVRW